jgi:hypothetical protein
MRTALIIVLFPLLCSCAFTPTEYSRSGVYAGGALAASVSDFSDVRDDGNDFDISESVWSTGFALRGGYRFLDRFAGEIAYEDGQDYDHDDADVHTRSLGVQGKFYPLTGVFQPYGMIGTGWIKGDVSDGGPNERGRFFRFGAGLEMYVLGAQVPLFVEIHRTEALQDARDFDYSTVMAGFLIRF